MRMQDKANRGSRKESFGEISDRHMRQPQGERNAVQKRTFARWMNVVLQRVKLLGIDASGIADGVPSVVLNLVWIIVLHFQDHTTYIEVPEIPHFGSLESVSSGETLADNAEAQAMLGGLAKSSEQLLWKRWSRTSSGSAGATSHHTNEAAASDGDISSSRRRQSITEQSAGGVATSPFNKKRGRRRSNLQPPSPLDAGIVSPEIRSWMEKGTDRLYSKPRVDESHLSLSSEEGIYSLSVLDSDEEDAYSYILDLNKEVFQPYNQPKRQVPRVEEETVEEMNGESKHQESCQMLNGCSLQEGPVVQRTDVDLESEVRAQSGVPREFGVDKNGTSFREVTSNRPVFDKEPEDESSRKENPEEGGVVRGQINDYSDYGEEETENVRLVTHGYDEAEALIDEAQIFKMAGRQKEVEEDTDEGISVKWVQVSEKRVSDEEDEENTTTFEQKRSTWWHCSITAAAVLHDRLQSTQRFAACCRGP
ncbi:hypothetical protein F2P81_023824 [Scophthalmus maximus]|uniref:Uncharacterized protein n=1 Tax=Scophthalmus maximus TaxID=52904 RepID=A0A6A4RXK4_SCOMX|nr:hypothetical protein F2P81_023824 [Scophthalmus maximus]